MGNLLVPRRASGADGYKITAVPVRTDKIIAPERQAELLDLIGTTVGGKYKLERLLGAGGMGGVYAATPMTGAAVSGTVAIKVLSVVDPASRDRIAGRFAREARAVTALKCPHIVTVLDSGSDDARPYLVMELLEGEDLGQRLHRDARVPLDESLHVAAQVLVALGSAHEAGIVHRDLKPDNIFLVKRDGTAALCKLLDFGMSKFLTVREGQTLALALTKKGMAVGTPYYMAPEQARALADVDGRADLWALGAILFECLAGRPPFVASTQEQILLAVCTTDAPDVRAIRPEVPSKVAKLIARAMTRERDQRFANAWEMLAALVEIAPAEAVFMPARPTIPETPVIEPVTSLRSSTPDRSGPFAPTIAAPSRVSSASDASRAPPKPRSSRVAPIAVGLVALFLGVALTVYVLSMLRAR
jgi:serine/threonine-protein kinase